MSSGSDAGRRERAAARRPAPSHSPRPPRGLLAALLRAPSLLFRAHLDRVLGHRFLLLVQVGRTSCREHRTVLEVVGFDPATDEAIVVAGWGRRAQWLLNVEAGGAREIMIAGQRYRPTWRLLGPDEAAAVFAGYEHRNRVAAPVISAVLSRLLGWRYDGTPAARRRAVAQLGLVAFRPSHVDEAT